MRGGVFASCIEVSQIGMPEHCSFFSCVTQLGWTPLVAASVYNHVDTAKLLLGKGAEIEAKLSVSLFGWRFPLRWHHTKRGGAGAPYCPFAGRGNAAGALALHGAIAGREPLRRQDCVPHRCEGSRLEDLSNARRGAEWLDCALRGCGIWKRQIGEAAIGQWRRAGGQDFRLSQCRFGSFGLQKQVSPGRRPWRNRGLRSAT